jgi:hypothetical protein
LEDDDSCIRIMIYELESSSRVIDFRFLFFQFLDFKILEFRIKDLEIYFIM